jgi:hypothetical protein
MNAACPVSESPRKHRNIGQHPQHVVQVSAAQCTGQYEAHLLPEFGKFSTHQSVNILHRARTFAIREDVRCGVQGEQCQVIGRSRRKHTIFVDTDAPPGRRHRAILKARVDVHHVILPYVHTARAALPYLDVVGKIVPTVRVAGRIQRRHFHMVADPLVGRPIR